MFVFDKEIAFLRLILTHEPFNQWHVFKNQPEMQSNGDISPSFVFRGLGEPIYSVTLSPNSSTNSGILWSGSESGI